MITSIMQKYNVFLISSYKCIHHSNVIKKYSIAIGIHSTKREVGSIDIPIYSLYKSIYSFDALLQYVTIWFTYSSDTSCY